MESSSNQNPQNNDRDPAKDETHQEESNSIEEKESLKSNKIKYEGESSYKNETSESAVLPGSSIKESVTPKKDKNGVMRTELIDETNRSSVFTRNYELPSNSVVDQISVTSENNNTHMSPRNSFLEMLKAAERNMEFYREPLDSDNTVNPNVITSEKKLKNTSKTRMQKIYEASQKIAVVFAARQQGNRQPFAPAAKSQPPPPHYYSTQSNRTRPNVQQTSAPVEEPPTRPATPPQVARPGPQHQLNYVSLDEMSLFPYLFTQTVQWASYPSKISGSAPVSLAHFIDAEVMFVLQKLDMIELITGYPEPNFYLILNKRGECLYSVYETSDFCGADFVSNGRGFQLHIMDVYQNEVIFMNKPCGFTYYPCCYPVIEVYSPPTVPLGAVTKFCVGCKNTFAIIDVDENILFTIKGGRASGLFCGIADYDITIHALDANETQVGFIRREYNSSPLEALQSLDYYGISFPRNMDVKMKALFLGALFLISLKRTGWVLRNVEDPETVSGHMYRMSIMTFLIPESSGVDKTKCMKLSLVHDLAECIVGDLTPYCGVDANEKHRQEEVAMKELTKMIGVSGAEIYTLYKEYEAQVTDESKFVKDLDRLDMILQAFEYEKLGDKPGKLEEFFKSTFNKFHFPWTIDIVKEIYKQRNLHINKDNSLGKNP